MSVFGTNKGSWLGTNEDLFTLRLSNVTNYADGHSLWSDSHGGHKDIVEAVTGNPALRLRAALDRHRGHFKEKSEFGFKAVAKVFSDVLVWIPEIVWRRHMKYGGDLIALLTANLSAQHAEDLGEETVVGRSPAYLVMPEELPEGDIVFQFGRGVFVPGTRDRLAAWVQLKGEDQDGWTSLPEWIRLEDGRPTPFSPGIYSGQAGMLIGCTQDSAPVRVSGAAMPEWFARGEGAVFINYCLRHNLSCTDFVFSDEQRMSRGEIVTLNQDTGEVIFRYLRVHPQTLDAQSEPLLVRVVPGEQALREQRTEKPSPERKPSPRISPTPPPPSSKTKPDQDAMQPSENTALSLVLEGIALPRLDPILAETLTRWRLWIDAEGNILESPSAGSAPSLTLSTLAADGKLRAHRIGAIRHEVVQHFPWVHQLPTKASVTVTASFNTELFLGLLGSAPIELAIPIHKTIIIGRDATPQHDPDCFFGLNALGSPDTLHFRSGKEHAINSLGTVRLSRGHVEIHRQGQTVTVRHLSRSWPSHVLRRENEAVRLDHGLVENVEMHPGNRLIIGVYILRLEQTG